MMTWTYGQQFIEPTNAPYTPATPDPVRPAPSGLRYVLLWLWCAGSLPERNRVTGGALFVLPVVVLGSGWIGAIIAWLWWTDIVP